MHQKFMAKPNQMDTRKRISCIGTGIIGLLRAKKHNALLRNCKIIQNFLIKESWRMCKARKMAETQQKEKIRAVFAVGMC